MEEIIVGMGAFEVCERGPTLVCLGIGSCIAVMCYDRESQIYGMAHVMLPLMPENRSAGNPNRYADVCIPNMIEAMISRGSKKEKIVCKISGGAHMFPSLKSNALTINVQNIEAVKKVLHEQNILILAEETGGNVGRTVKLFTEGDRIEIIMRSTGIMKEL
jgi:chemotaxis protein CheD